MRGFIVLLVMCLNPIEDVRRERVDVIESNHFYDELGRLVFDQIIFYDWSPEHGRYMVRAWRLVKNKRQLPARDWRDGYYVAIWQDTSLVMLRTMDAKGKPQTDTVPVIRCVQATSMRETWTQYDPELIERHSLPPERRLELRKELLSK